MNSIALPVISLVLGTVLGLLSSLIASSIKQRQAVTEKRIDYYFEARKELVDIISILADLNIHSNMLDKERDEYRQKIATLYFKNLDILPTPVLHSLLTLHATLKYRKGKLFQVINSTLVTLPESEYSKFVHQMAAFKNTRIFSGIAFKSKNPEIRKNLTIKLHAQNVLYNLNKFASTVVLIQMAKDQSKKEGL